jgi:isopentenyldiphosphate isomerase
MSAEEWLPLVDPDGRRIGKALRSHAHGNPELLHPVVHCLVVNSKEELLLQLRSCTKDVQPGRWDTSVGGHVGYHETVEQSLMREIREELGIHVNLDELLWLHRYVMTNSVESELVTTFLLMHEGPFVPEPLEIDELRFWSVAEIERVRGQSILTPNFEDEFNRYRRALAEGGVRAGEPGVRVCSVACSDKRGQSWK